MYDNGKSLIHFLTLLFIVPIPGQFFNPGPPRPLIPGIPNAAGGFRLNLPPQLPTTLPRPRLPPQNHQNKFRLAAPPKTTVFVGNISEEVETNLLQKICEVRLSKTEIMHYKITGVWKS